MQPASQLILNHGPRIEAELLHKELSQLMGTTPPYQVTPLCTHFGLSVDRLGFRSDLGALLLNDGPYYYIVVNRKDPVVRQRFSIAHELYHYLAHRRWLRPIADYENDRFSGFLELEANRFAAELLMPRPWVLAFRQRGFSVETQARAFRVSLPAMRLRFKELRFVA